MESGGINGIRIKYKLFSKRGCQMMMYYELFQSKEGRILYVALVVLAIVLFIIDRFVEKKRS